MKHRQKAASNKNAASWEDLKERPADEQIASRDVYRSQQLSRSKMDERKSPVLRIMLAVLAALLIWAAVSLLYSAVSSGVSALVSRASAASYYKAEDVMTAGEDGLLHFTTLYYPLDEDGNVSGGAVSDPSLIPVPDWYESPAAFSLAPRLPGLLIGFLAGLAAFALLYQALMRNLEAQNLMADTSDINPYQNDQHIAFPEELMEGLDWFPDAGAHSSVCVSTMISHVALSNKGLKPVTVQEHAARDIYDADGVLLYRKGEALYGTDGALLKKRRPMIDEEFADALFEASGAHKSTIRRFDASKVPYNPGNLDREKQKGFDTAADLINGDWEIPDYETQRPAGAYLVDTQPANTMVLAITRAGKGQTIIEPTIDMWLREKNPSNMVVNDPKGELLLKNYAAAKYRGFDVVQFNLINPVKTSVYNPLMLAADAARKGDFTNCAKYVDDIAKVFFPVSGSEDPVWPNAASNAFKRAAFGLIDYCLEEEAELQELYERGGVSIDGLALECEKLWGTVTLYNAYQFFVYMTSKKRQNPSKLFEAKLKMGLLEGIPSEQIDAMRAAAGKQAEVWNGAPEADMLTLFFNASMRLPKNQSRELVSNAHSALMAMGGADKMIASVYGIAITAMNFFTDPTIMRLTSGLPSQNIDLASLSFPRRIGVRFSADYFRKNDMTGLIGKWDCFKDAQFSESYDSEDFRHSGMIGQDAWAWFYFKGIFPENTAWIRLRIYNPNMASTPLVDEFYFKFEKDYRKTLDGLSYQIDPVLGTRTVAGGTLEELIFEDGEYLPGHALYGREELIEYMDGDETVVMQDYVDTPVIALKSVGYTEKPKAVFLVTPPHMMAYAKVVLILISQLVGMNFGMSYLGKENQKPLYRTRYMLDELGNLQSDGNGIDSFQTYLSIGLGQEQQFTLILQTLQQLKDVYGDSVDKIIQGNTANIVFLKSTDDSLLDTLQKMSGTTHRSWRDSKTVTKDVEKLFLRNEGKVSYTMSTREEPVISYNDMSFIPKSNSIVFRAGASPVWNRNETILPMSYRLSKDRVTKPGADYTLTTIPGASGGQNFDPKSAQPDFEAMFEKRMDQAVYAEHAEESVRRAHGWSDMDVQKLDPNEYSAEIMKSVRMQMRAAFASHADLPPAEDNREVLEESAAALHALQESKRKIFAGVLSKNDLVPMTGGVSRSYDKELSFALAKVEPRLADSAVMRLQGDQIAGPDGTLFAERMSEAESGILLDAAQDAHARVYSENPEEDAGALRVRWQVTEAFIRMLAGLDSWAALENDCGFESAFKEAWEVSERMGGTDEDPGGLPF